jgi:hypothetical protein
MRKNEILDGVRGKQTLPIFLFWIKTSADARIISTVIHGAPDDR